MKPNRIQPGDLVKGGTLHNWRMIGLVVKYRPNKKEEFLVHWFAAECVDGQGYTKIADRFLLEERYYDLEVISKNPLKSST